MVGLIQRIHFRSGFTSMNSAVVPRSYIYICFLSTLFTGTWKWFWIDTREIDFLSYDGDTKAGVSIRQNVLLQIDWAIDDQAEITWSTCI